jgi:hypothetical protein
VLLQIASKPRDIPNLNRVNPGVLEIKVQAGALRPLIPCYYRIDCLFATENPNLSVRRKKK